MGVLGIGENRKTGSVFKPVKLGEVSKKCRESEPCTAVTCTKKRVAVMSSVAAAASAVGSTSIIARNSGLELCSEPECLI